MVLTFYSTIITGNQTFSYSLSYGYLIYQYDGKTDNNLVELYQSDERLARRRHMRMIGAYIFTILENDATSNHGTIVC